MTIYEGSRYDGALVLRAQGADGRFRPTIYAVNAMPQNFRYRNYVVQEGERLDTIAYRLWSDPELWWRLANYNPDLFHPAEIPVGTVLRIPV